MRIPIHVGERLIGYLEVSEQLASEIAERAQISHAGFVLRPTILMGEKPKLLDFTAHWELGDSITIGTCDKITTTKIQPLTPPSPAG